MRIRGTAALIILVVAIAMASAVVATFADATRVRVNDTPQLVPQGKPVDLVVEVSRRGRHLDGYRPVIEVEDAFGTRTYGNASEIGPGRYRVRVVFPRLGQWKYVVKAGAGSSRGSLTVIPR